MTTDPLVRLTNADADLLRALVIAAASDPDGSRQAAAALNVGRFRAALDKLLADIEADVQEPVLQKHLEAHPWMFGSEYSELLDQRKWTRNEQQDFVLRRTTDGYIEVIEIKTPLEGRALFRYDRSHDTYFPGSELSTAIGQIVHYLEEFDADRLAIEHRDEVDVNKVRAKIIIGRDGDEEQCKALRSLNGHLHRIEILTFDQLARIAGQVVRYLEGVLEQPEAQPDASDGKDIIDLDEEVSF